MERTIETTGGSEAPWDMVLRPHSGWLDLHLEDLWRYRDLILLFVRRDFVSQFKQTVLGPTWFILQPLLSTIVFTVVFGQIANIGTDGLPQMLFYMSGNVLWLYFAQCLTLTAETFRSNAHIFGKVYFPRLVVPVSVIFSQMLRLLLQLLFFGAFWIFYRTVLNQPIHVNSHVALLPVLVLLMAMLGLGCGLLVSSLTTKYRDLHFLLQFGVQLLMYSSTVVYPLSKLEAGSRLRMLILANPMTPIIETFRFAVLGSGSFSWAYLAYSAAFALLALLLGTVAFSRIERTFMDTV